MLWSMLAWLASLCTSMLAWLASLRRKSVDSDVVDDVGVVGEFPRLPYTPVHVSAHHYYKHETAEVLPSTPKTPLNEMQPETSRTARLIKERKTAMGLLPEF